MKHLIRPEKVGRCRWWTQLTWRQETLVLLPLQWLAKKCKETRWRNNIYLARQRLGDGRPTALLRLTLGVCLSMIVKPHANHRGDGAPDETALLSDGRPEATYLSWVKIGTSEHVLQMDVPVRVLLLHHDHWVCLAKQGPSRAELAQFNQLKNDLNTDSQVINWNFVNALISTACIKLAIWREFCAV